MAKREKKPFPFFDGAVNELAAIRVMRMVKPECPVDSTPEIKRRDGSYSVNPRYTGESNCMQVYKRHNQGVWDVEKCESLGHDPWHTIIYKRLTEDVIDPETGEITDQKVRLIKESRLNVIWVSRNVRHSSNTEVQLAKARGCLTLDEYGAKFPDEDYLDPCEFRACTNKVTIETQFGNFCSERHARLVAADQMGIATYLPNTADPYELTAQTGQREQQREMDSINLNARRV